MKKSVLLASLVVAAASAFADNAPVVKHKGPPPRKPNGGLLLKEEPKDFVCVRNRQGKFTNGEIAAAITLIRDNMYLPVRLVAADAVEAGAKVEIVLEDSLDSGRKVLAAPQDGWAALGVEWLLADSPAADVRTRRLYLALARAIGMSAGVGLSMYQPCFMTDVREAKDLDRIKLRFPGPEGQNNFDVAMKMFGVQKLHYYSYRQACVAGWAPQPTNDVQKTIWEETHKLPDQPIKIEFDPKRDKGK